MLSTRPLLIVALLSAPLLLAGCTTYTFPDGSQETLWGVPADDETLTREERDRQAPRYRVPGEMPE
ncbi:hypothetical protein [Halomonas sp. PGE1]|uniref:hypothetical protein n=1 Tax=Halomonas sp. PGE1 TaxID=2730360 RepID=UPI001475EA24|nr:hypothetical protein [Halomonas sp. PGE1]QJQ99221.1 hypothetical protein HIR79_11300 [Halomonas sp. PGE1]